MIQLTERERGKVNKEGENERLLTPAQEKETQTRCLYALCLSVHVGESGHFRLLAGSGVVDGQMAGEGENV